MNYYSPYTGEHIVTATPSDWMASTEINPEHDGMFFKEGSWVEPPMPGPVPNPRIAEIKSQLDVLDFKKIRPLAAGDTEYLAILQAQTVILQDELKSLLYPSDIAATE